LKGPPKKFSFDQDNFYHLTITELFKNALSIEEIMNRVDARKALAHGRYGEVALAFVNGT
jgi:hypothetical protein